MKTFWGDLETSEKRGTKRPAKSRVYGLYKRIGLFKMRLLCTFSEHRNGAETKRHMGRGYSLKPCKVPKHV
jgi:hypothetical protein